MEAGYQRVLRDVYMATIAEKKGSEGGIVGVQSGYISEYFSLQEKISKLEDEFYKTGDKEEKKKILREISEINSRVDNMVPKIDDDKNQRFLESIEEHGFDETIKQFCHGQVDFEYLIISLIHDSSTRYQPNLESVRLSRDESASPTTANMLESLSKNGVSLAVNPMELAFGFENPYVDERRKNQLYMEAYKKRGNEGLPYSAAGVHLAINFLQAINNNMLDPSEVEITAEIKDLFGAGYTEQDFADLMDNMRVACGYGDPAAISYLNNYALNMLGAVAAVLRPDGKDSPILSEAQIDRLFQGLESSYDLTSSVELKGRIAGVIEFISSNLESAPDINREYIRQRMAGLQTRIEGDGVEPIKVVVPEEYIEAHPSKQLYKVINSIESELASTLRESGDKLSIAKRVKLKELMQAKDSIDFAKENMMEGKDASEFETALKSIEAAINQLSISKTVEQVSSVIMPASIDRISGNVEWFTSNNVEKFKKEISQVIQRTMLLKLQVEHKNLKGRLERAEKNNNKSDVKMLEAAYNEIDETIKQVEHFRKSIADAPTYADAQGRLQGFATDTYPKIHSRHSNLNLPHPNRFKNWINTRTKKYFNVILFKNKDSTEEMMRSIIDAPKELSLLKSKYARDSTLISMGRAEKGSLRDIARSASAPGVAASRKAAASTEPMRPSSADANKENRRNGPGRTST